MQNIWTFLFFLSFLVKKFNLLCGLVSLNIIILFYSCELFGFILTDVTFVWLSTRKEISYEHCLAIMNFTGLVLTNGSKKFIGILFPLLLCAGIFQSISEFRGSSAICIIIQFSEDWSYKLQSSLSSYCATWQRDEQKCTWNMIWWDGICLGLVS